MADKFDPLPDLVASQYTIDQWDPLEDLAPDYRDIEDDRWYHFNREMDDGTEGLSLLPRGVMGGAHGSWSRLLDLFGARDSARYHREQAQDYGYTGNSTWEDVKEKDIGVGETFLRALDFMGESAARSYGELAATSPALRGVSVGAKLAQGSGLFGSQLQRQAEERALNDGNFNEINAIDDAGLYASQIPVAALNTMAERFGVRAPIRGDSALKSFGAEVGTEAIQEGAEEFSTKVGTLAEPQMDILDASLAGAVGSGGQASVQAGLSGYANRRAAVDPESDLDSTVSPFAPREVESNTSGPVGDFVGPPTSPIQGPFPPEIQGPPRPVIDPMGGQLPLRSNEEVGYANDPSVMADMAEGQGQEIDPNAFPDQRPDNSKLSQLALMLGQGDVVNGQETGTPLPEIQGPPPPTTTARQMNEQVNIPLDRQEAGFTPPSAPVEVSQSTGTARVVAPTETEVGYDVDEIIENANVNEDRAAGIIGTTKAMLSSVDPDFRKRIQVTVKGKTFAEDGSETMGNFTPNGDGTFSIEISASNVKNKKDLQATIAEELAHASLAKEFDPQQLREKFEEVSETYKSDIDAWLKDEGYGYQDEDADVIAEEWTMSLVRDRLAEKMSGSKAQPKGPLKSLYAYFKDMFKRNTGKSYTFKEVEEIVLNAAKNQGLISEDVVQETKPEAKPKPVKKKATKKKEEPSIFSEDPDEYAKAAQNAEFEKIEDEMREQDAYAKEESDREQEEADNVQFEDGDTKTYNVKIDSKKGLQEDVRKSNADRKAKNAEKRKAKLEAEQDQADKNYREAEEVRKKLRNQETIGKSREARKQKTADKGVVKEVIEPKEKDGITKNVFYLDTKNPWDRINEYLEENGLTKNEIDFLGKNRVTTKTYKKLGNAKVAINNAMRNEYTGETVTFFVFPVANGFQVAYGIDPQQKPETKVEKAKAEPELDEDVAIAEEELEKVSKAEPKPEVKKKTRDLDSYKEFIEDYGMFDDEIEVTQKGKVRIRDKAEAVTMLQDMIEFESDRNIKKDLIGLLATVKNTHQQKNRRYWIEKNDPEYKSVSSKWLWARQSRKDGDGKLKMSEYAQAALLQRAREQLEKKRKEGDPAPSKAQILTEYNKQKKEYFKKYSDQVDDIYTYIRDKIQSVEYGLQIEGPQIKKQEFDGVYKNSHYITIRNKKKKDLEVQIRLSDHTQDILSSILDQRGMAVHITNIGSVSKSSDINLDRIDRALDYIKDESNTPLSFREGITELDLVDAARLSPNTSQDQIKTNVKNVYFKSSDQIGRPFDIQDIKVQNENGTLKPYDNKYKEVTLEGFLEYFDKAAQESSGVRNRRADQKNRPSEEEFEKVWRDNANFKEVAEQMKSFKGVRALLLGQSSVIPQNVRGVVANQASDLNERIIEATGGRVDLQKLAIDGLGGLKDKELYRRMRYEYLGELGAVQRFASDVYDAFKDADAETQQDIYIFLTTKGASVEQISQGKTDEKTLRIRRTAGRAKARIRKQGRQAVNRGWMTEETFVENFDSYLPQMYLKHVLEGGMSKVAQGGRLSDRDYSKLRKLSEDNPEDSKAMDVLGKIFDPGFLSANSLSTVGTDIITANFFDQISQGVGTDWILPKSMTKVRLDRNEKGVVRMVKAEKGEGGKSVSWQWLQDEASRIKERAAHPESTKAQKESMLKVASDMEQLSRDARNEFLEYRELNAAQVRARYVKVPNSKKYGVLAGSYLDKTIYNDLVDRGGLSKNIITRGAQKLHSMWKWAKVPANPPTWARNAFSNTGLMILNGMPPHRAVSYQHTAFKQFLNKKGEAYRIGKQYGIDTSTFTNQEIKEVQMHFENMHRTDNAFATVRKKSGAVIDYTGNVYAGIEVVMKMAMIQYLKDQGASDYDAFIRAQDALFDYSAMNKGLRNLRRFPLGAPFVSFYALAVSKLGSKAVKNPIPFLLWGGFTQMVWHTTAAMFEVEEEELDRAKAGLPDYLSDKPDQFLLPLPFRDSQGRLQFFDLAYIHPMGAHLETLKNLNQGEWIKFIKSTGLGGAPILQIATAMLSKIDPFTERPITDPGLPEDLQRLDWLNFFWRTFTPSWANEQGFLWKSVQAATGKGKKSGKLTFGDVPNTMGQALARAFGLNIYGVEPQKTAAQNILIIKAKINEAKQSAKRRVRDARANHPNKPELVQEIMQDLDIMLAGYELDALEMKDLMNVHPNLRVDKARKKKSGGD